MNHYVYILKSQKDKGYYIGYTTDIKNRVFAHNEGLTKSTKGRRPLGMVCYQEFSNKKEALDYEKFIKSSRGAKTKIEWIKENDQHHGYY